MLFLAFSVLTCTSLLFLTLSTALLAEVYTPSASVADSYLNELARRLGSNDAGLASTSFGRTVFDARIVSVRVETPSGGVTFNYNRPSTFFDSNPIAESSRSRQARLSNRGYARIAVGVRRTPLSVAITAFSIAAFAVLVAGSGAILLAGRLFLNGLLLEVQSLGRLLDDQTFGRDASTQTVRHARSESDALGLRSAYGRFIARVNTDTQRRISELNELGEALSRSNRDCSLKSELLAHAGHELRSPLSHILLSLEALEASANVPELQRLSASIRESSGDIVGILEELVDRARLDTGRLQLQPTEFDLRSLLNSVIDSHLIHAGLKNISLSLTFAPELNGQWIGDRRRLRQVLENIVGNAVKYTDRGSISLEVTTTASESAPVLFRVNDTGLGIRDEDLPSIFEPFGRGGGDATDRPGSGLGLAISSDLIKAMGGLLSVESRVGFGSSFSFDVALSRPVGVATRLVAMSSTGLHPARRILVVDDIARYRVALAHLLSSFDVEVVEADDGDVALETFRRERFDAVLMDLNMPRLPGDQAAAAMRRIEALDGRSRTIILAISGATHLPRVRLAEFDATLTKPFGLDGLRSSLLSQGLQLAAVGADA